MSKYHQIFNQYRNLWPTYQEIFEKQILSARRQGEKGWEIETKEHSGCSKDVVSLLKYVEGNVTHTLEVFILSQVLGGGPRIFQFDHLDFNYLEMVDINIGVEDYVQPFKTIVIELPDKFVESHMADCPQTGAGHKPILCILHWEQDKKNGFLIAQVLFDSLQSYKVMIYTKPGETIEEEIRKMINQYYVYEDSLETSEGEREVTVKCLRACINAALLVDEIGIKTEGPKNKKYYEKLRERLQKGNKHTLVNRRELTGIPLYYTVQQDVKLYSTITSNEGKEGGGTIRPHLRRGYYKMQPHGEGRKLRKRIRIAPVFVNAGLFAGKMCDTETRHRVSE